MRFPLADWIDEHSDCRHNLGQSGMRGSIRRPRVATTGRGASDPEELRGQFAQLLHVRGARVLLTHGATEANSWVTFFVRHKTRGGTPRARVRFPEYPPLFDIARWSGFVPTDDNRPVGLAVVSRPRNPEGDLWPADRLFEWADGASHLLVDETFREFAGTPSIATEHRRGLWATGTLTKFFAADDVRVGFVVAPEEEAEEFARFVGVVSDEIPDRSVAGALSVLRHRTEIRERVLRIIDRNRVALRRLAPEMSTPLAPVFFDRSGRESGDHLARRALRASVLVCPGSLFGDASGVRVGMTRRTFPEDLAAYWTVRSARGGRGRR